MTSEVQLAMLAYRYSLVSDLFSEVFTAGLGIPTVLLPPPSMIGAILNFHLNFDC